MVSLRCVIFISLHILWNDKHVCGCQWIPDWHVTCANCLSSYTLERNLHTFVAVCEFTTYLWRTCLLMAEFYFMMCNDHQLLIVDRIIYLQWLQLFVLRMCRHNSNTWVIYNDLVITSGHRCNLYLWQINLFATGKASYLSIIYTFWQLFWITNLKHT